jgi:hypothetical protein
VTATTEAAAVGCSSIQTRSDHDVVLMNRPRVASRAGVSAVDGGLVVLGGVATEEGDERVVVGPAVAQPATSGMAKTTTRRLTPSI